VKAKKLTSRMFRTSSGAKVTVELRRGLDPEVVLAALEEVASRLRAELGDGAPAA
jgi:hypothetical protein